MTEQEYLQDLEDSLKDLPVQLRHSILESYTQRIRWAKWRGLISNEFFASLPDPKEIAELLSKDENSELPGNTASCNRTPLNVDSLDLIEIHTVDTNIEIETSDGSGEIELFDCIDDHGYRFSEKDKKLKIVLQQGAVSLLHIRLPQTFMGDLVLKSEAGDAHIQSLHRIRRLEVELVAGDICVGSSEALEQKLKSIDGNISLDVESDLSDATVQRIETGNGNIYIFASASFAQIECRSGSGDLRLECADHVGFHYSIKTVSGNIRGLDSQELNEGISSTGVKKESSEAGRAPVSSLSFQTLEGNFFHFAPSVVKAS